MTAGSGALIVGPDLALPVAATVTGTHAFLGRRGSGKSNAAVVLAEQMWAAAIPFVALDPKGDWWGVRAGDAGLPIPVFGGLHGDMPLDPSAGRFMAQLIVDMRLTCVLDLSDFDTKVDQVRFSYQFADALFRAKRRAPGPLHLFLEEADEFVPQQTTGRGGGDEPKMVGAYAKFSKQGRSFGLGVTLVSQRSASVSKNALSQTGTLVLFQTTSPNDQRAVLDWIDDPALKAEVRASLATLAPGESWVLSPGDLGITARRQWARRSTFDSGATPVLGLSGEALPPVTLADINLGEIEERMAATIEAAAADDPAALRRRIQHLERDLAAARAERPEPTVVEVPVVPAELMELLTGVGAQLDDVAEVVAQMMHSVASARGDFEPVAERRRLRVVDHPAGQAAAMAPAASAAEVPGAEGAAPEAEVTGGGGDLVAFRRHDTPAAGDGPDVGGRGGVARMMRALAAWPGGLTPAQLGTQARMAWKGGAFNRNMKALTDAGWARQESGRLYATDAGVAAVGGAQPPADPAQVQAFWRQKLNGGAQRMFDILVDRWPEPYDRENLIVDAGMTPGAGAASRAMSQLTTNDLAVIDRRARTVVASPGLFQVP